MMNSNPKKYNLPTVNQQINEPSILLEKKQTQKNEELLQKLLQLGKTERTRFRHTTLRSYGKNQIRIKS